MSFDLSAWGDISRSSADGIYVRTDGVAALVTATTYNDGEETLHREGREYVLRLVALGRANTHRDAALRDAIVALLPADPFASAQPHVIVVGGLLIDTRWLAPLRVMGPLSVTCECDHALSVVVFDDGEISLVIAPMHARRVGDVVVLGRFELPRVTP